MYCYMFTVRWNERVCMNLKRNGYVGLCVIYAIVNITFDQRNISKL